MDSKEAAMQSSGYVSGDEEFELAPEKLVLVGEGVEEVNSDAAFVDADDSVTDEPLPSSEVVDYVEKENKVVDSEGDFDASGGGGGGVGAFNTESNLVDKVDVNSNGVVENGVFDGNGGNLVVDEVGIKGKELELELESEEKREIANGNEVGEPEANDKVPEVAVIELEKSELVDTGDVELNAEGDSVVDTIQVNVTGPGVVVVGEKEENKDVADKPEAENSAAPILPEGPKFFDTSDVKLTDQGDSVVDAIQIDVAGPGVAVVGVREESNNIPDKPEAENTTEAAVFVPDESKLVDIVGDVKLTDQQDSDVAGPEVAVVGVMEEIKDVAENTKETAVFVPEEPKLVDTGDVKLTDQGDSVVDAIKIDVAAPGVAVGVVTEENENDSKIVQEESKFVEASDAEFTTGGDSVVDTIQIAVAGPAVVVIGETEEKFSSKIDEVEAPLKSSGGADESSGGIEESARTREIAFDHQSLELSMDNSGQESARTREIAFDHQNLEPSMENSGQELRLKQLQSENHVVGGENSGDPINGSHTAITSNDSEAIKNDGITQSNGDHSNVHISIGELSDELSEKPESLAPAAVVTQEIAEVEDEMDEEIDPEDSDTDGMVFGSSEAARKFIEELEQGSETEYSHTDAVGSLDQSQRIDGQIVTDSEEEGDSDEEGDGKELFDSAALAALLKAATGHDSEGGNITITSQDGSRLFSVERPAGLGSSLRSLRPTPRTNRPNLFNPLGSTGGESEESLSEDEKKKLAKLQGIRVKFLRLVHRLGLSLEESVAAQVLYRLALLGGRQGTQTFSLDSAKHSALQLEEEDKNSLDFSINILVLGKSGVGKSATINSIFREDKASAGAFETGTVAPKEISGLVDGVKVRVFDTPGLKSSAMEQSFNRSVLSSVAKVTKKSTPDVVLYVDRLDTQTRDLNDLPLLKTVSSSLGPSIWRNAVVTLTHSASAPPDGPSGTPLSYETFVSQRSHVVQQSIGHAVGDLRMMSPSLMNPISLVENHRDCRKNREGEKILPNGQSWRPQLLLLCYSMKILSEASQLSKPQDPFDHRKLFGFRARSPPLPYMLSSMLQSREHPKLPSDQGVDSFDSDIDLDDFSDNEEEEDEYDQLPPFKPLRKAQVEKLSREQRKAYLEEYDYRVKLLQKKQWKEELRRMREMKKRGKNGTVTDYDFPEEDPDSGAAAPVAVPLPDMTLPASFDGDNPAYRYRFLEPTSQFLARPVLDTHGWDHDCGYDGVNLEHSLAIASSYPLAYTVQITKDKKDFTISLDSSISAKYGENISNLVGFDIQSMGKQLAYIIRGETKIKNLKKHKAGCGLSFTLLGENVIPGVKIEDQIKLGKQFVLVGSAGAVKSQHDTAYGANFELQRKELDYPIGQVQSTFSMSIIKWRGDLALGFNSLAQFAIGRNSKVAIRAGINNKLSGQVTVRTSSSDHLSIALAAVLPTVMSIYKKLSPGAGD